MDYRRIFTYVGMVFGGTFVIGFFAGFIRSAVHSAAPGQQANEFVIFDMWVNGLQTVAIIVFLVLTFARLAILQRDGAIHHAMLVSLIVWVASYPISVLIFGQPAVKWGASIALYLVTAFVGVPIGSVWRRWRHSKPVSESGEVL